MQSICEKGGTKMPHEAYLEACEALDDDYERVREAAIDLVKVRIIDIIRYLLTLFTIY